MPKKWQNHWPKPDTQQKTIERDRKLLTLGNLTIITQALNASIRDAAWDAKKQGGLKKYAEGIDTFSEFLAKSDWNEDVINERAAFLLEKALEIWEVPNQEVTKEFYVNYGVGDSRSWDDAMKYGFVSAGGGQWYSSQLKKLEIGSRIWVYIPNFGYVGVGTVTHTAKPARDTMLLVDGKKERFFTLQMTAHYHKEDRSHDKEEYIVAVDWIKTVSQSSAVTDKDFFSNQSIAARPIAASWHYTLKKLKELWGIED
jgi:hypothetical protein